MPDMTPLHRDKQTHHSMSAGCSSYFLVSKMKPGADSAPTESDVTQIHVCATHNSSLPTREGRETCCVQNVTMC